MYRVYIEYINTPPSRTHYIFVHPLRLNLREPQYVVKLYSILYETELINYGDSSYRIDTCMSPSI